MKFKHISNYRKIIFLLISICILSFFYTQDLVFAEGFDTVSVRSKIDVQVMKLIKFIGYSVVLLCGLKDALVEIRNGDMQGVWNAFLRYLGIYAALLMFPTAIKWIEAFVEGLM